MRCSMPKRKNMLAEQQGGHNEEETEIQEVLTEVRGALRRFQVRFPYILHVENSHRIDSGPQLGLCRVGSHSCYCPETGSPEFLPGGNRMNAFRGRPVEVPVILVDFANAAEVHGEGRIPIGNGGRVGDAGVLRGKKPLPTSMATEPALRNEADFDTSRPLGSQT